MAELTEIAIEPIVDEPISVGAAKEYLSLTIDDFNSTLETHIRAAREVAENNTNRSLKKHQFIYTDIVSDGEVTIPKSPIQSVDKVEYFNGTEWAEVSEADYMRFEDVVMLNLLSDGVRARITFTTKAYESENIKRLMLELVSCYFDNRPDQDDIEQKIVNQLRKHQRWQVQ